MIGISQSILRVPPEMNLINLNDIIHWMREIIPNAYPHLCQHTLKIFIHICMNIRLFIRTSCETNFICYAKIVWAKFKSRIQNKQIYV